MLPLRSIATRLSVALLALAVWPAAADYRMWQINEMYGNASGTVQYVELTALASNQQNVQGHTLVMSNGTTSHVCNASSDLPGDTTGHRMLFGTAGVAAAFGVTPDYICADNFIFREGGTINWGEGSDLVAYNQLPTNGQSLNLVGSGFVQQAPTPKNFGPVTEPPPTFPAYQAMWWASPAGSESGWGVNTVHQGDTLFATWFTYGPDGNGLWLIMSSAEKTANGVYTGTIYTTRGPAFNAQPFNPSQVVATPVGTGTFTFASTTGGTFAYTVNGISQTKTITRYEFGSPVPTCTVGGTPNSNGINYSDLWWNSPGGSESGWGLNIVHQGAQMFLTWFTYALDGSPQWLVMSDVQRTIGENFTGRIYRTRGNPFNSQPWSTASVTTTDVGSATVAFSNRDNGTFTYTLDGISQSKAITRIVYGTGPTTVCNNP